MGGGPSYPKPTNEERNAQQAQADLLNQYRGTLTTQLQQQNLLAPYIYKQLNLAPDYNDQGQLVGLSSLGDTPEQIAAKQQQQVYMQQLKTQQLLQPYVLQSQGYTPQYDEQGNIVGVAQDPNSNQALQQQVQRQYLDRAQRALNGQLDIDPGLNQQLATSEQLLRSRLQQQLGPGYETSGPGIQALAQFQKNKDAALYGAAHGDMTNSTQLALGLNQSNVGNTGALLSSGNGVNSTAQLLSPFAAQGTTAAGISSLVGGVGAPYTGASGLGTLSQLYGQSLSPYAQQRQGEYGADLQRYGQQSTLYGGIGAVLGGVAGGIYGGPLGAAAGSSAGSLIGRSFA